MATRFSVSAIFNAVDRMSGPVKKMQMTTKAFSHSVKRDFMSAQRQAEGMTASMGAKMGNVIRMGALAGVGALGAGLVYSVKKAADMEMALASFTTMMKGNGEEARILVNQLQVLGAQTPFEFEDLQKATVMLMGFGAITKDTAIPTLKMLGDISQGSAEKLNGISLAYGQIMAGGKANMQDINQLINNQVPILGELASMWDVTAGEARKMVSQGRGTSTEITKAFQRMTSEGGTFYNGMIRASTTFTGLWSTMQDALGMTAASIGDVLLPTVKEWVISITKIGTKVLEWVQSNKELISKKVTDWLKTIKFVLSGIISVLEFLAPFIPIILSMVLAWQVYHKTLLAVALVQNLMKMRMSGAALAIALLAGLIFYLVTNWSKFSKTTKTWIKIGAGLIGIIATIIGLYKSWVAIQTVLNIVMALNPIGLIIIAIAAFIGFIILAIKYWDKFGAAMTLILGPIGMIISFFKSFYDNWSLIKDAFTDGGFIAGIKMIGLVIIDSILKPIQQAFNLVAKIPGMSWAGSAAGAVGSLRPDVITQREATSTAIQNNNSTQRVVIENQSGQTVRSGGSKVNTGTSLKLSASGSW